MIIETGLTAVICRLVFSCSGISAKHRHALSTSGGHDLSICCDTESPEKKMGLHWVNHVQFLSLYDIFSLTRLSTSTLFPPIDPILIWGCSNACFFHYTGEHGIVTGWQLQYIYSRHCSTYSVFPAPPCVMSCIPTTSKQNDTLKRHKMEEVYWEKFKLIRHNITFRCHIQTPTVLFIRDL